jgi:tetratricopeptide (TPR) repeat protein
MRARPCSALLLLAVILPLNACQPPVTLQSPVSQVQVAAPAAPEKRKPAAVAGATVRQNIRQQLAAENYPAALALIRASGLSEAELAEEVGRALKGVLTQAEGFLQKDLPEKAGPLYRAALDGYPKTPAGAARIETNPAGITAGIETCADRLMERGLAAYRSGDLDQAIEEWKLIHVFAPRHQASRQALQTAEVQLANLKKMRTEQ